MGSLICTVDGKNNTIRITIIISSASDPAAPLKGTTMLLPLYKNVSFYLNIEQYDIRHRIAHDYDAIEEIERIFVLVVLYSKSK